MTADPLTLAAEQVVYSNVETEQSPTRRRGFQLWQHSAGLDEAARREVSKRLEDFRLPVASSEADGRGRRLVRWVYATLPDGRAVVARTVPNPEKDKFGRGGRFHAHALVLTPEDFARLGCDPFRVMDGYTFQDAPADGAARHPDYLERKGEIPAAQLALSAEVPASPASDEARALVPELAGWLAQPAEGRVVALPLFPAEAADWLRSAFALLPPGLRRECAFDTLSSGLTLVQVPYRVAGAYSAELLKRWTFRRTSIWDGGRASFLPPLPGGADSLAGQAARVALARGLSHADQEAAGALLAAVRAGDLDAATDARHPAGAVELVMGLSGLEAAWDALADERLRRDLPFPRLNSRPDIVALARHEVEDAGPDRLKRLGQPFSRGRLDAWLCRSVTERPLPLSADDRAEVKAWLADRSPNENAVRLHYAVARWGRNWRALEQLLGHPLTSGQGEWFREWAVPTLDARLRDPAGNCPALLAAPDLLDQLRGDALQADLDLLAVLGADSPDLARLRLLRACCNGDDAAADAELQADPAAANWLLRRFLAGPVAAAEWVCYIDPVREQHLIGVRIPLGDDLAGQARSSMLQAVLKRPEAALVDACLPFRARLWRREDNQEALPIGGARHKELQDFYRDARHPTRKCGEYLRVQPDLVFAAFVNDCVAHSADPAGINHLPVPGGVWLGLVVRRGAGRPWEFHRYLLEAAVASVMPLRPAPRLPAAHTPEPVALGVPDPQPAAQRERRRDWLLARLTTPENGPFPHLVL